MQPFYTTRGGAAPLFFKICGVSRHHHPLNLLNPLNPMNPHAEGVSNGEAATTTLGPKGRRPLSEAMQPFYTTCGGAAPLFFKICGVSRHHHPLNLLNPLNPMNPHAHRACPMAPPFSLFMI